MNTRGDIDPERSGPKQAGESISGGLPTDESASPRKKSFFNGGFFRQKPRQKESISAEQGKQADERPHAVTKRAIRQEALKRAFTALAYGNLNALGEIFNTISREMFGYIRAIVGSSEDSEDVFQEVFARLAVRRKKLLRVDNPLAYLFTIARNESFKLLKKRGKASAGGRREFFFEDIPAPEEKKPRLSPREAQGALSALPRLQREVVVLKIYEGFTFAEIGELTGVSPNTAASRYRYALSKMAVKLKKHDEARG